MHLPGIRQLPDDLRPDSGFFVLPDKHYRWPTWGVLPSRIGALSSYWWSAVTCIWVQRRVYMAMMILPVVRWLFVFSHLPQRCIRRWITSATRIGSECKEVA